MVITGWQTLAWRLRRQSLAPARATGAEDVLRRVLALRAWPAPLADLAVATRLADPAPGALQRAIDDGDAIRSYAFRGGSYAFVPDIAATLLAVRTATGIWRSARWQRQGSFVVEDWEPLREAVRSALADGPLTRDEIAARLAADPDLRHLETGATGKGSDSLYKPLHWWGDICFGPERDGRATFRLLAGDPRWPGLPDVDDAGRRAIELYLGAYGPATLDNLGYWLAEGLGVPRRRLIGWLADLGDAVTEVTVDGIPAYLRTADIDDIGSVRESETVCLLPGFDPWILGPGTADPLLIPPGRRALFSHGANPVLHNGRVSGTWKVTGSTVTVAWFDEAGRVPVADLGEQVAWLAAARPGSDPLTLAVEAGDNGQS